MTKQTIEIEGLPEGWEPVTYRVPDRFTNEKVFYKGQIHPASSVSYDKEYLIVKEKQPRRIVLEETGEERSVSYGEWLEYEDGLISQWPDEKYGSNISYKVWREVKESDLSLNKDEPKLSLSVGECKEAMRKLETFNVTDLSVKICRFLKEHS